MDRRVKLAVLLGFVLHGVLILTARYRLSYDAYNHMFFADHYLRDWWSLWETRWYTGFEIVSYPPLIHQLIALFGKIIGVDAAFALILWATLTAYPLAVYHFSRIFVGPSASSYAAIGTALLPSIYLTGHVFGQLPTLVAALLALFGAAVLAKFLRHGGILTGALAVFLFASVIAAHHATLLFLPWLIAALAVKFFFYSKLNRTSTILRLGTFVLLSAIAGWLVIFPFWQWGMGQTIQTTIDHLSRHNFFQDPFASVLFFLPMYGLLIPLIPFALWMTRKRRFLGLGFAFIFLFLLGLGATTPLPRLFFQSGWAWLTYDRFAFWASLLLQVFFGAAVVYYQRKRSPTISKYIYLGSMVFVGLLIGTAATWLPTQPPPVDMQPVVDFLEEENNTDWRYLTFGFGDQLAYLSRLTEATTIDGSYHTARSLPELRASGIGQVDTAFWLPGGLSALDPILQESGEYGVRWGFVNLRLYIPVLVRNDWRFIARLDNGVQVWENPKASLPPPVEPPTYSPFTTFTWGTFPLFSLMFSGALALRRSETAFGERILSAVQTAAVVLLPLSLTLWSYRRLFSISHERIYFTYSDALIFVSDGLALVSVLIWLVRKIPDTPTFKLPLIRKPKWGGGVWLFSLCVLATISALWSIEWRTSLYIALHCWLGFGLFLSLRERPGLWRPFAIGALAALLLQATVGTWQAVEQTSALPGNLELGWAGVLSPSESGASVVELDNGFRWLRAYGTLPHPNLLGGWTIVFLISAIALILVKSKWRIPALLIFNAGLILLLLTFSRSAWLGFVIIGLILFLRWRRLDTRAMLRLLASGMLCITLVFIPLQQLFSTRLTNDKVQTEFVSNYTRIWLVKRTGELIKQNPVIGVGMGSYSLALSQHVAEFYDIEPVHNIPLLAWSELGIGGVIILLGMAAAVVSQSVKAQNPLSIVFSAALAGLFVISLFDHYLWTLAPGRILFFSVLGLWSGQVRDECNS